MNNMALKHTLANDPESFNQISPHEPPLNLGRFTPEQGSWESAADVCMTQSKAGTRVCPAGVRRFVDGEA